MINIISDGNRLLNPSIIALKENIKKSIPNLK